MSHYLTIFAIIAVLTAGVLFVTNDGRLAPRHALVIFGIALGVAFGMPDTENPPDTQVFLGFAFAAIVAWWGFNRDRRADKSKD